MGAPEDSRDGERIEQEFRIVELKRRAEELTGGKMSAWESENCPPDLALQFWEQVVAFESAPETTHFDRLVKAGVGLPAPETMTDEELSAKLWEVIARLAAMRVYLENTDHLSDRELYSQLWHDTLREWTPDLPPEAEMNCHLDMVGSGSEEDIEAWMRFFADDDTRAGWLEDFPDYAMPAHEDPPHDRDRRLLRPGCEGAAPPDVGWN